MPAVEFVEAHQEPRHKTALATPWIRILRVRFPPQVAIDSPPLAIILCQLPLHCSWDTIRYARRCVLVKRSLDSTALND